MFRSVSRIRGKNIQMAPAPSPRCRSAVKNKTSEDHSAPFTFWDHPGCSSTGKTEVSMATGWKHRHDGCGKKRNIKLKRQKHLKLLRCEERKLLQESPGRFPDVHHIYMVCKCV